MIKNPITQESLKKLQSYGYEIVSTQTKELVCKDVGDGAMAEPQTIFYARITSYNVCYTKLLRI